MKIEKKEKNVPTQLSIELFERKKRKLELSYLLDISQIQLGKKFSIKHTQTCALGPCVLSTVSENRSRKLGSFVNGKNFLYSNFPICFASKFPKTRIKVVNYNRVCIGIRDSESPNNQKF